jgi:hypothetical protein
MEDANRLGFTADELTELLEPLMRRVVREELARALEEPEITYLSDDSPLYEGLLNILDRKERGTLKFHSHQDVWGE